MPTAPPLQVVTLADRPEMADRFWPQKERIWPEFMFHDIYADKLWHHITSTFAAFQLYFLNEEQAPIAVAQTIPCVWDGTLGGLPIGWQDGFLRGVLDFQAGHLPNTLQALEVAIQPEYTGQGISYQVIDAVKKRAGAAGFQAVIVAVRPSLKQRYPLTPMERYVRWTRADGAPFDPWLRVHWRRGGEILNSAHPSMVIEGSVDEWEAWTGMAFPESGDFVVPGALAPVQIDRIMNLGRYVEPNIWVHHPITTARIGPSAREPDSA